jgi:type IV pilus assembly protein PilM
MAGILAIEFGEQECKVVVGETGRGKPMIRDLFRLALPKNDNVTERVAERARLLKEALAAHKVKARRAHVIVPKNFVMARMVTLPSTNEDEIAGMARFEAERHIPFNAERHVVSHHVLNKLGVEGSQVLLAAIDRPIAQEYVDICRALGLTVESIGVSSLAVFNAYAAVAGDQLAGKVVTLLNIGFTYTDLVIVNEGILSFTRGTSVSIQKLLAEYAAQGRQVSPKELHEIDVLDARELTGGRETADAPEDPAAVGTASGTIVLDAPVAESAHETAGGKPLVAAWLTQLLKEMRRTYEFARREFNCPPITDIEFTGEGALLHNLDRFFKVNFGVEASVFNPREAFEFAPSLAGEVDEYGVAYAAALGALAPQTPRSVAINLIPPEYTAQLASKRRRQSYVTTGILVVVMLVLAFLWVWELFSRQSELLAQYEEKNRQMKERVEDLENKRKKLEIIRRYIQDKHGALDIIDKISSFEFIPDRVTLTRFEYQKDEAVKIEGHAKTLADINRLDAELKKTGIFESVVQDQGSNKPVRLPNRAEAVLQFQMTCTFPKRNQPTKSSAGSHATRAESMEATGDGTE